MSGEKHFRNYSLVKADIRIELNMDRFNARFQRSQYQLDGDIMNSMIPYMTMVAGTFIDTTRAASAALQGTGTGAKKVLVSQYGGETNAKEYLTYTKTGHPKAQAHWFDAAKAVDGKKWVERAKATAGGG